MKRTIHVLGCLLAVLVCGQAVAGQSPIKPVSAICVEAESGLVLFQQDADVPRPPASMVKLMMMLLVAEGVEGGTWTLQQPIAISTYASSMGGTQVFLKAGEVWPLAKMMDAVAVASANDGAVAVAEGLWGTLAKYLETANRRALELGMIDTVYRSANGLPPDNGRDFDLTTARDMAVLARACVQHDMIMRWVGQREFQFRETDALKSNTNKLLWRMPDCDGMKTGYIRAAGFCITATAQRGGVRLISVVMGNPSKYDRFNQAQQLLEGGFRNVRKLRLVAQGQSLGKPVPVNNCATPEVRLTASQDLWVTVRNEDLASLQITAEHPATLLTPITAGSVVGEVRVKLAGATLARCPLTVPTDLEAKAGLLTLENRLARDEQPPVRTKRMRRGS